MGAVLAANDLLAAGVKRDHESYGCDIYVAHTSLEALVQAATTDFFTLFLLNSSVHSARSRLSLRIMSMAQIDFYKSYNSHIWVMGMEHQEPHD
ncbi:hypothetical protein N7522_005195 [Penicillium canescens]|nr:hypothetical protein N7522_005195 [Penicillium canescens]